MSQKCLQRLAAKPPEAEDIFVKICYFLHFCHGFKSFIAMFAFTAYKCSTRNGRKFNLETEKWHGKHQKVGGRLPARHVLRRQRYASHMNQL